MKKILLALLTLTLALAAYANPVDESAAKSIAENFLRRPSAARLTCKGKVPAENKHLRKPLTAVQAAQPAWYVFNFDGGGFVIVAGEDTVEPILGYSKTGRFEYEGAPDNVRWWMDGLASDIAIVRSEPSRANPGKGGRTAEYGNVVKQYTTAKWYQDTPYNNECPVITGGSNRGVTGCVATAGAIVMRYFSWPDKGEGTTTAYSYTNEKNKTQTVAARTLGRAYDWNNMIMDYSGNYTSTQASAVAAIMVDVGVASQMQYGYDEGSGTFDENLLAAMQKHFKYNKSAYRACRESYSDDEWLTLLKENLDNVGPMPYGGADDEGGHEFVFDGYSDQDFFSVNWGWGGVDDGFFRVSSLILNGWNFAYDQSTLLGLSPDRTGTSTYTDRLLMYYYSNSYYGTYPGLETSTSNFRQNVSFTANIWNIYNDATMPFNGKVWVALYDKRGNKKENVSSAQTISNLENMYIAYALTGDQPYKDIENVSCTITSPIKGGDRLRVYYEGQYSNGFVYGDASNVVWEIIVKEDTGPSAEEIAAGTSLSYDKATKKMTLTCAYDIDCKVKNASGTAVISKSLTENTAAVLDFSSQPSGTYSIVLSGSEDFTLSFKL
ncbi:MAG: C10 family peptidase [Bacteroidales bacterium]|nr:C10 family peptidase [Bacteroidales bacterium]